ncbi:retromer subunit PEP8 KNAG_0E02640 [Huiozyma naganishii CBS 8797]|uniref:Arrestin-like N-terminal domain-containing protein n=1 Tax=Huiozyma naganishii (strain ATCC MYA-139 / BCRC 22969 / CBS 8797 / KCTC 17520 / NBRC 10181 / NCYC 3082 / Yp74L-3) TaxID=1071383 RepID=J7RLW0_HUIN7|nr:hypothetical protein KNAG_0E02640 [Kazachstania naganishii CBS 8797]CCK70523.1 hypothetical protein KNAG_0E02640 [Kazachstania naganishii CBS 8797]
MSIFFKSPIDIEVLLDGEENRKHVDLFKGGSSTKTMKESLPLYEDGESIAGLVTLRVRDGRSIDHLGVKVSVIGSIDMVKTSGGNTTSTNGNSKLNSNSSLYNYDDPKKKPVDQFLCLSYDLCPAGELNHSESFPFTFKNLSKRYESYRGKNVDVTYYVKVTVMRKSTDISKAKKFWVHLFKDMTPPVREPNVQGSVTDAAGATSQTTNTPPSVLTKPVRLDIGIENCLHIEFEYSKAQYSLNDVIVGRIYFLLTRLKVRHMELSLLTRETSGLKPSNFLLDSTSIRYEIMDGSPVKGETIPIRLFLSGYDLTPNMSCNYFNIKNYLNLVIIDEDGRRYFKQSEISLYRTK